MTAFAEVLYEHWCSSSYELRRQPAFAEASPTLRRVFTDQAQALEPAIELTVKNAVADALISAANGASFRGDIGKEGGQEAADYLLLCAQYAMADDEEEFFEAPRETSPDARVAPAVNTFRRVMAREGVLTSIEPARTAMVEALAAADAATASIPEVNDLKLFIGPTGYSHIDLERDGRQAIANADILLTQATEKEAK